MSKVKVDELVIDGTTYVPKDSVNMAEKDGLKYVMVRTHFAGVHYGLLERRESTFAGIEVTLLDAKRVWYWSGASSLSQLSQEGTKNPSDCKIPCAVPSIELVAIEIMPMSNEAIKSLNAVSVWQQ